MPTITFLSSAAAPTSIDVPAGTTILKAAKQAGAEVGYVCGGVCACSTCHVYVKQGRELLSEQEEEEEDILDKAFDVQYAAAPTSCWRALGPLSKGALREPAAIINNAGHGYLF